MSAVFASNQPKAPTKSRIENGAIYVKNNEPDEWLFYENPTRDGSMFVMLDGYLICPMEMFTKRQIAAALKKYRSQKGV